MSLALRCSTNFRTADRARGTADFADGLVHVQRQRNGIVRAVVAGSSFNEYDVVVDTTSADLGIIEVTCDCPRFDEGHLCKHIWATLLQIDRQGISADVPGNGRLEVDFADKADYVADAAKAFHDIVNTAGRADSTSIPRDMATSHMSRDQSRVSRGGWQRLFNCVEQQSDSVDMDRSDWRDRISNGRQILYVISVAANLESSSLVVELLQREKKKNGELGKPKSYTASRQTLNGLADPTDRHLLRLLLGGSTREADYSYYDRYYSTSSSNCFELPADLYEDIISRLCQSGRFLWALNESAPFDGWQPIGYDAGPPWQFRLKLVEDPAQQAYVLRGELWRDEETAATADLLVATDDGILLFAERISRLADPHAAPWLRALQQQGQPAVAYRDRNAFLQQICNLPGTPELVLPEQLASTVKHVALTPQGKLTVSRPHNYYANESELEAHISFVYGGYEFPLSAERRAFFDKENGRLIRRDPQAEQVLLDILAENNLQLPRYTRAADAVFPAKRLKEIVDNLTASGWLVVAHGKLIRSPGNFSFNVTSATDWFDLDAQIDFDGESVSLPTLLAAVRQKQDYVELDDGSRGMLPQEWLDRFAKFTELGAAADGVVRYAKSQALLLDALLAEQESVVVDFGFREFREKLQTFAGVKPANEPRGFGGELRGYQRDGLGWLHFLRDFGFGGCLADDMGLGKTVQVLALLEGRRRSRAKKDETKKPSIVVAPTSLVFNWLEEASRFTPKLKMFNYTGLDRKRRLQQTPDYDVLLTSYGTLRRDIADLNNTEFDYAILDEAQAIKNHKSQASKACRLLRADQRLAMTGTPIENHLGELWALFDFLNPGLLGRSTSFGTLSKNGDGDQTVHFLSQALRPFILRRTKQQVLKELPTKTEQTLYCEMPAKQRKQYNELRDHYRQLLTKKVRQQGLKRSKMHVLEALLRLRQAACDPRLLDAKNGTMGVKLSVLVEQLEEVLGEGHKALVFSQFTSLLALVRTEFDAQQWNYSYLDGRTRKRAEKVKQFQEDKKCQIFLISLKAGGQGLNLTAADFVFILDPWWNPAVEAQAVDRAHRIGQKRSVTAYRLICKGTVEEKILKLQESKRQLAESIINADNSILRSLTSEDLQLLLS